MGVVAIQADHITQLRLETDSSMLFAEEWCRRGFEVFWYHPSALSWIAEGLNAIGNWLDSSSMGVIGVGPQASLNLKQADVLMVRQDPPFDSAYLANTYILENIAGCFMVNHPKAIRNCSEKLSALNFPHLIPPTLITSDAHVANEFLTAYHNAVIKPLFGFGGMDVMRIKAGDDPQEGAEIIKRYISEFKTCILQKYIPTIISEGDKRVFIVDGKILGGIRRMPAKGNFLAGVASGGTGSQLHKLSGSDISIAQEVALWLDGAGIFMAGIDIIGDNLIEINVTSPTGFKLRNTLNPELQPIEQEIIDLIQDRI